MKRLNNSGITLIALVITIIVLLILAGISIAMLTGSNGILNKANQADLESVRGEAQERINLALDGAYTDLLTEKYVKGAETSLDGPNIIKENGLGEPAATKHGKYYVDVERDAGNGDDVVYIYWEPEEGYGDAIGGAIKYKTGSDELPYEVVPADSKVKATATPTSMPSPSPAG